DSFITSTFYGQLRSHLRCPSPNCDHFSRTYNAFNSLQVDLPSLGKVTLTECIKKMANEENSRWHCSKCKKNVHAFKKLTIWKPPTILIIQLKRFMYEPYPKRIDTEVEFPLEGLDLSEYVGACEGTNESFVYDCYAVSNHYGGLGAGHYTAHTRKDNSWLHFDDDKVSQAKPSEVGGKKAYTLYYKRRELDNPAPTPAPTPTTAPLALEDDDRMKVGKAIHSMPLVKLKESTSNSPPDYGPRRTGREFEAHSGEVLKHVAQGLSSTSSATLGMVLHGSTVYTPWVSVPAIVLAKLGFRASGENERAKLLQAAAENPEQAGWNERGGDKMIVCSNGRYIAVQDKDVRELGHCTNIFRFLALATRCKEYNLSIGMSPGVDAILCYPGAKETHVTDGDIEDLSIMNITLLCMDSFKPSLEREPRIRDDKTDDENVMESVHRDNNTNVHTPTFELRDFQTETISKIVETKGIHLVRAPTGTGKSSIIMNAAMEVHRSNKQTVVFVTAPYIDHIRQLFRRFEPVLEQYQSPYQFVASETPNGQDQTVQDIGNLVTAMKNGTRYFFATAASANLLIEVAKAAKKKGFQILVVNDEAHYSSQEHSAPMLLTLMVKKEKGDRGIVATATPDGNVMEIPNMMRTLELSLDVAIQEKYCSDYSIVVPLIYHREDREKNVAESKLKPPVAIQELMKGHDINAAALFTVNGMQRDGGRRCIAYVESKQDAKEAEKALQGACKALAMSCWTRVITCEVKPSKRKEAFQQFATGPICDTTGPICDTRDGDNNSEPMERPMLRFLIAVKILDQCIDIPETDTIAIMHTPESDSVRSAHRAIQRGGRSMRPKPDFRIAHWYIFCEHSDSAANGKGASAWFNMFLAVLAEFDPGAPQRVSIRSSNPVSALAKETLRIEAVELKKTMKQYEIYCKKVKDNLMVTKANEFVEFFSGNSNTVPKKSDKSVCFDCDGRTMGRWWDKASGAKGCIATNAKVMEIIKACAPLRKIYQEKCATREAASNLAEDPMVMKTREFVKFFLENDNTVPLQRDKKVCFSDGKPMGRWWDTASGAKGCIATNAKVKAIIEACAPLCKIYQEKCATRDSASILAEDPMVMKAREFVEYVSGNGNTVPKQGDKKVCFSDGKIMGRWWDKASGAKGCIATDAKVMEIIKGCAPLWNKYEDKCATRNLAKAPIVTKANEFVEFFLGNDNTVPKARDKKVCFSDGKPMGTWWSQASLAKGCIATDAKGKTLYGFGG
ncbi:hypothetical protein TrRE_jg2091, partial [Triparma retinervis]